MEITIFLAQLLGTFMIVEALFALIRPRMVKKILDLYARNDLAMVAVGFLEVIMGLLLVLTHNIWGGTLVNVVSLISWLVLIEGLLAIFVPQFFGGIIKAMRNKNTYYLLNVIGIVIGFYLASAGFGLF